MKKYQFLLKPVFFIVNLLLATWLVLVVESIKPSDFSRYKSLFISTKKTEIIHHPQQLQPECKAKIIQSAVDYKAGLIDSTLFRIQVEQALYGVQK